MADYRQVHDTSDGWHRPGTCGTCDKEHWNNYSPLIRSGTFERPRPDMRWVPGVGRVEHEPENVPTHLPAPPKVAVYVSADLVTSVKAYVDDLEMTPYWRKIKRTTS